MAKADKAPENKIDENVSLDAQLTAKRAELFETQKNLGGALQNPHAIKKIKKDIARILTKINATKGEK